MSLNYRVFYDPPEDFSPIFKAAGCYCESDDHILLLKRHPSKSQGKLWGVPAGKMEAGEDPKSCVIRELEEETGVSIAPEKMHAMGAMYIRLQRKDYTYYVFRTTLDKRPELTLALDENTESCWVTVEEALEMPLVAAGVDALNFYTQSKIIFMG